MVAARKLVVNTTEAAQILSRSRRTVQDMCRKGDINAFQDGVTWLIEVRSLEEYVERHTGRAIQEEQAVLSNRQLASRLMEQAAELTKLAAEILEG